MEIRIKVPRMPTGLPANLLSLAGLIAVTLAVGGLTGNWWYSVLVGGLLAVGMSYVITTHGQEGVEPAAPAPVRAVENGHSKTLAAEITREAAFLRGEKTA